MARFRLWAMAMSVFTVSTCAEVTLELKVPPAETYVIGDAIPLSWRFCNQSTQALGFMWDGCCRLNGQLEVRGETSVTPLGPGLALAHRFAKADRLDPGTPKDFTTTLSDWFAFAGGGRYTLQGTYRGVLSDQVPQVPRGLALWRGSARSEPISLRVLSPEEYLLQREEREQRLGWRITLSGPAELPALSRAVYSVTFENRSSAAQTIRWPDDASLWVMNPSWRRTAPAVTLPNSASVEINLPPEGRLIRRFDFELSSDRFEGEPLGDYHLFVDLTPSVGGMRVPSNVIPLAWRLDDGRVIELLNAAAGGARTGARNMPLKLLRTYLAELSERLAALDLSELNPETRALGERLLQAARLKPLAPKAGVVKLTLSIPAVGQPAWKDERVRSVAATVGGQADGPLGEILGLRRHLGWEIDVVLEMAPDARVAQLLATGALLIRHEPELAHPLGISLVANNDSSPARMRLRGADGDSLAGPLLRISSEGRSWSADGRNWNRVANDEDLSAAAASFGAGSVVGVEAVPELRWSELVSGLSPMIPSGVSLELIDRSRPSNPNARATIRPRANTE